MFSCSQRNSQNHKKRKINLITKFLTASLRHLKICIPSKTHFSYSVEFSVEATTSSITFQDCISFNTWYKSTWQIQHHYHSIFLPFFILHWSQDLLEFIENKNSVLGCKQQPEKNSNRKRRPPWIILHLKVHCITIKKCASLKPGSHILTGSQSKESE